MSYDPPSCAWSAPLGLRPSRLGKPRGLPVKFIARMVPVYLRIRKLTKLAAMGLEPPMAMKVRPVTDDGYNQGVPIGGMGSGSIGRSFRGDFARWHLEIGRHEYEPSLPNQFHLRIEGKGEVFVQTLNPRQPEGNRLTDWSWGMDEGRAIYHALFPFAWTTYDFADKGLRMVCKQLSPVIAHNYVESSYPVGVFAWKITNISPIAIAVSLMLTWENAVSPSRVAKRGDFVSVHRQTKDRVLIEQGHQRTDEVYPVSFGLGAQGGDGIHLSLRSRFDTEGNGADIWNDFRREGSIHDSEKSLDSEGRRIGSAVCAKTTLQAGESKEIVFAISWDIPIMRFGSGREWYRRYTRFFDTSGDNAAKIADTALDNWRTWEQSIEAWQKPIVKSDRPDWLKCALVNELYYLVDGGTAWETGDVERGLTKEGTGHFGYLECADYMLYNTYDVHFYTFALIMNFPEIDNSIQRDFADAVLSEDNTERTMFLEKGTSVRKPLGVVPHDLGSPLEDPWFKTNSYRAQDVSRWKDLNTKFVLQVWRNYNMTGDQAFLAYCWPAVKKAMEYIDAFDRDGDGLPENEGFPDQTYDVWLMEGPSAYCGGLYLAAATAMIRMAESMREPDIGSKYRDVRERGMRAYETKLWNGSYYNYDASGGKHSDSVMADQLAGQWYAAASDLDPIVSHETAVKALQKIFELNVMGYAGGEMGAMNGMRPSGGIDMTSIQSSEVWAGTTYALAALMIHEGLIDTGLRTAKGIYNVTYRDRGYWFRTPEAWTADGNFRAILYMRPLAVWAIEHALTKHTAKGRD